MVCDLKKRGYEAPFVSTRRQYAATNQEWVTDLANGVIAAKHAISRDGA